MKISYLNIATDVTTDACQIVLTRIHDSSPTIDIGT